MSWSFAFVSFPESVIPAPSLSYLLPSVIPAPSLSYLAFPFCHPCEREDPVSVLFMNAGKSKNPGSPIGVGDDRGGEVGDDRQKQKVAASPPSVIPAFPFCHPCLSLLSSLPFPSVILAFPFCHPCEREDPVSVLFMNAGKSKNPGSPIGVGDDRGGEVGDDREVVGVAASPPSVILAFPFCHPCLSLLSSLRTRGSSVRSLHERRKKQTPWIPDRGRG